MRLRSKVTLSKFIAPGPGQEYTDIVLNPLKPPHVDTLSLVLASQDMSIKRITASICPASEAKCKGVLPV